MITDYYNAEGYPEGADGNFAKHPEEGGLSAAEKHELEQFFPALQDEEPSHYAPPPVPVESMQAQLSHCQKTKEKCIAELEK